jgi:hypothetical protein
MRYLHGSRTATHPSTSVARVTSPNAGRWGPSPRTYAPPPDVVDTTPDDVIVTVAWPGVHYVHRAGPDGPACGAGTAQQVPADDDVYACLADQCYGGAS